MWGSVWGVLGWRVLCCLLRFGFGFVTWICLPCCFVCTFSNVDFGLFIGIVLFVDLLTALLLFVLVM